VSAAADAPGSQSTLQTERLVLRRFVEADVPALVRELDDPEIAANTLSIPHPYTEEHARSFLARVDGDIAAGRSAVFAACDARTGALVGAVGLHIERAHRRAELGFWVGRAWRRRGLAREAVGALLDHAFGPLDLERVYASHYPWNPASGRVLAAAGLRPEGTLRGHHLKGERRVDGIFYGILRDEHTAPTGSSPAAPGVDGP